MATINTVDRKTFFKDHIHLWKMDFNNPSQELCFCRKIKISLKEKERRIKEYDRIYNETKHSESYSDYKEMQYYFNLWSKYRDYEALEKMKEIRERISKRIEMTLPDDPNKNFIEHYNYSRTPPYPDPTYSPRYEISED